MTFGYVFIGSATERSVVFDMLTKNLSGRDMVNTVSFYKFLALGAFSATRSSKDNYIKHIGI